MSIRPPTASAAHLERIQAVTEAALAHLALDELLETLLTRIQELVGANTAAVLLFDAARQQLVARAAKGLEEEVERGVRIPVGRGFAGRIAAQARPVVIDDVDHADILNPILRERGVRSLLGVPLVVEGQVIGVLHVGSLTPRFFTEDETQLLQAAGDRAALAIAHSQAYEDERKARARLESLETLTEAALAHLTLDDLLEALLTRVRDLLGTDTAAVLLFDDAHQDLVARAAKGLEEAVERGVRIPVGRGFAGRIAAERRPVVIDDVDHADILNPVLRERGVRSLLGVPLVVEGDVLGVLHVGTLTPRRFTEDDTQLLQAAGDRAALAIEHARLFETERRARELAEARAPAALALEYVGDGVFLLDDETVIRFWNPAAEAVTGVSAEAALGRPVDEVVKGWESVRGLVPVGLAPAATRAEVVPIEVEGRELWLSISGVGFRGGTVYAFRDVTEQRRLEEWQAEFIATVSHEFRTPMASIYGAAETLRRGDVELSAEVRQQLMSIIYEESDRLARLVDEILLASRIQAGRLEFRTTAFDAAEVARSVLAGMEARAPAGIELALVAPEGLPPVAADRARARDVLSNLVENAVKYSPGGGSVEVRLEPQQRHMRFAVRDEGLGVPPQERAHLFERFYRIEEHARLGIGGTGLGLYICQELVRRMGGRIWLESSHGPGSLFIFELPLEGG